MDTISSSARLSIRQIRDVNLAWVRTDLGDLTELRESIKAEGLHLPILMTTNMLVADGARRLVAYEELGHKDIPVLITSDWEVVRRYYTAAHKLEQQGYPCLTMPWQDVADLLNGAMKELYAERYRALRNKIRDRNSRLRERGDDVTVEKKNLYNEAATEVLRFRSLSTIRTLREAYSILAKMSAPAQKGESPEWVNFRQTWAVKLREQMVECQQSGGDRIYAVLTRIRTASKGKDPSGIRYGRSRLTPPKQELEPKALGSELTKDVLNNINELLQQLAATTYPYTHVRPNVPRDDAVVLAEAMKSAVRKINSLIKVVKDYGNDPNLEERARS